MLHRLILDNKLLKLFISVIKYGIKNEYYFLVIVVLFFIFINMRKLQKLFYLKVCI